METLSGGRDLTCPALAPENLLKIAAIKEGFVLRSVGTYGTWTTHSTGIWVGAIAKRLVRRAKLAYRMYTAAIPCGRAL